MSGVANVSVFGGEVRQLQIQVKPERLVALGLGIDEVVAAARRATGVRGAGFIEAHHKIRFRSWTQCERRKSATSP